MVWNVKLTTTASKTLRKLDPQTAKRIYTELEKLKTLENPRAQGKALTGNKRGYWRYRVGDYRIICLIEDDKLTIITVKIGHRSTIYSN